MGDRMKHTHTQVLSMSENQRGEINLTERAASLSAGGGKPGQGYPVAVHLTQDPISCDDFSPSIGATAGSIGATVRRLTPLECERLMGWPDDHTRYDADGNELPDSFRYRACGNGVVAPVAEWIGRQLLEAVGDTEERNERMSEARDVKCTCGRPLPCVRVDCQLLRYGAIDEWGQDR